MPNTSQSITVHIYISCYIMHIHINAYHTHRACHTYPTPNLVGIVRIISVESSSSFSKSSEVCVIFQPWVLQQPAWSTVGRLSSALVRWSVRCLDFVFNTKMLMEQLEFHSWCFKKSWKSTFWKTSTNWTHEFICQMFVTCVVGRAMILW